MTDADLVLGRMSADVTLPGLGRLDLDAARRALDGAAVSADGVVAVVDAAMVQAVRRVSVERGVDPRHLALVAFGGAGPLHACAIAAELDMPAVVVPPRAGVLSAVGLLAAPTQRDLVRSWPDTSDHAGLEAAVAQLASDAGAGDEVVTAVDCRYAGQSHEITVPRVQDFEDEHRRRNGYVQPGAPVEVVAIRASARTYSPVAVDSLPTTVPRHAATGPAVLAEADCTVWVPAGWTAQIGGGGAWILRPSKS